MGGIMFKWKGIEFRLVLALAMLSMTTLFLSIALSFTFNDLNQRLVVLKEINMPALDKAARLNDMVRILQSLHEFLRFLFPSILTKLSLKKINFSIPTPRPVKRYFSEKSFDTTSVLKRKGSTESQPGADENMETEAYIETSREISDKLQSQIKMTYQPSFDIEGC